jgi:uncharacterized membrane protein
MMKTLKEKMFYFLIIFVTGIIMLIAGRLNDNDFLFGIGIGLAAVSVAKMIQYAVLFKTKDAARDYMVASCDERNLFIAGRASKLTIQITSLAGLAAVIAFGATGYENYSILTAVIVCFISVLYLAVYFVVSRKY